MKSMASAFVVWRTVLDTEGHLLDIYFEYFNDAYERVSGVTLEQVRGKAAREVWSGTEQGWYDVYGEIARKGIAKSFQMYHEPTSGLYACNAYRPPNLDDRICVVFEDVTERKETLAQLEALASQQRAILNAVPAGISFLKGRKLQWINPELARMFEYEMDELRGANSSMLYMHPSDVLRVGQEGYSQLESGAVYSTEVLFKKKDGTPIWCHLTGQAVDAPASGKGSIWVLSDITERRQAEMALRESEQRFKRLVQHSSDMIVVTDSDCIALSVSDSVTRTLGYESTELVGVCGFDFIHPDDLEFVVKVHCEILETPDTPKRVEFRHRHKSGKWIPLELVGTNLLGDPSVKGVVHNLRDISERSQLTEQLQQAMKMEAVGRLAGGIAHDFNNLLTVITGNIELMRMDLAPSGSLSPLLDEAAAATDSAASLTRQLLAFSRRQMIEPKVLDLNELVKELQRLLARIIGEDIVLQTSLTKDLGAVRVDPGQFEQVLVNLVVNAKDAMPDGGKLILETSNIELDEEYQRFHPEVEPGRYVLLAVSDTGIGMDARVKQRIFEPFFTTKPKGNGTGLGLATIFGAVKQAGGSIEVYSELAKGTTIKVYLPRVEALPEKLARRGAMSDIPKGTETILLVEDEDSVRDLSRAVLRRLGYSVIAANCASEALSLATGHPEPIQLLMTDVVMPGMDGLELANKFTEVHPESKVLFASGYTGNIIVHHGVIDECTNFIGKPYTGQALAVKIREILVPTGEDGGIHLLTRGMNDRS